jgi:hypothetical protein
MKRDAMTREREAIDSGEGSKHPLTVVGLLMCSTHLPSDLQKN